jgi:hypothetical protein
MDALAFKGVKFVHHDCGFSVVSAEPPRHMTTKDKLRAKLMGGKSDKNFTLKELFSFVQHVGFKLREGGGSHSLFHKKGITGIINLQPSRDGKAEP